VSNNPPSDSPPETRRLVELPPVQEFNDRATLWLLEDPHNLRDLLRIHSPPLVEHLDFDRAERVNRSFIPEDLQKEESDLLFRIPFLLSSAEGEVISEVWIYVLLEHQSKPHLLMPLRVLSYLLALWKQLLREWEDANIPAEARRLPVVVPFVFYTGERNWNHSLAFVDMFAVPPGFARFVPSWETLFLDLRQTPSEQLTSFVNSIGWALRVLQAEKASYEEIERTLREAMAGLEGLDAELAGQWLRVAWYLLLLVTHRRSSEESPNLVELLQEQSRKSKFREREEWETMEMSYADYLKEQGRTGGMRSALETMLIARFGKLPKKVREAITAADIDKINAWIQAGATANTLEEVGILSPQ
jgi:predicted transposase YdaD